MSNIKIYCVLCGEETEQKDDGNGGFEVGISKWFNTIEPWAAVVILCNNCAAKLIKQLHMPKDRIDEQTPIKR